MTYTGQETKLPDLERPPLPPSVEPGGHGGSHGHLMNEFVTAILEDRKPLVDIALALNMTVAGHRRPPVGLEERRTHEDPSVCLRSGNTDPAAVTGCLCAPRAVQ